MPEHTEYSRQDVRTIGAVMRTFVRAYRAGQMYLANSPMLPKAIDDAREAFRTLWSQESSLTLTITERALLVEAHEVYREDERSSTALPWLLYRDGLRELVLRPGFEESEFDTLLALLQSTRGATSDDDDLVTLLWLANFQHIGFRNVEWAADFDGAHTDRDFLDGGETSVNAPPRMAHAVEAAPPGDGPPPGIVRLDEEQSSVMALDPIDARALQIAIRQEYATDRLPAVIDSLFDILETQNDIAVRDEVCELLDRLVTDALARDQYATVGRILRGVRAVGTRQVPIHEESRVALLAIADVVQAPAVVKRLLASIDMGQVVTTPELLAALFDGLGVDATATVVVWHTQAPASAMRTQVETLLVQQFETRLTLLRRLLDDPAPAVVQGALHFARLVANVALVPSLTRLFRDGAEAQRADAALALAAVASPGAMDVLMQAIAHDHRDVRVAVYKAIAATQYGAAFPKLSRELDTRALRKADLTEKRAFMEALVAAGRDGATPLLDGLLNGKSLLGYKEPPEMRACAAYGLGLLNTTAAAKSLERAAGTADQLVKRAVSQAMRGSS